jgi:cyclohexadienyl dehydratase
MTIEARLRPLLAVLALLLAAGDAGAEGGVLRVGTSGDYPPFSLQIGGDPPTFEGFDPSLLRAYASEHGQSVVFVPFRWPNLTSNLEAGRFDLAASGVTIIPDRSAVGRFTIPVAETGAVVLVRQPELFPDLEALDRPTVRIGVNAGGYLQRVADASFPRATRVAIPDNAAVLDALMSENVHAVVTDNVEAEVWKTALPGLLQLGPLTRDRKAFFVRADQPELAASLDLWLMARETDGSLAALRREYFGENAGPPAAAPLLALLAAVDERLSLMPMIAFAKRAEGLPLVVPRREQAVLDASVASTRTAAEAAGMPLPPEALVRKFFRVQIEAAKQVQWSTLKDPGREAPEPLPDVDGVLRPALLRVGEKITGLLVALPAGLDALAVRRAAATELRSPHVSDASRVAIADSITAFSAALPPQ